MTFDRRNAAGKDLATFLKDAEVAFLKEVLTEVKKAEGARNVDFKVDAGVSAPMMAFDGEDRSDLSVSGWVALIVNGFDVKVHMEMTHAQYGRKEDVVRLKIGEVTPALVAKRLAEFIFGHR